jgi:hypothetical protein
MPRRLVLVSALAVATVTLALAAFAMGAKPGIATTSWGEAQLDGGFTPKTLSRTRPTPIALDISGQVEALPGVHPPALHKLRIETDRNGSLDLEGIPPCAPFVQDGLTMRERCKGLIGKGAASFEIKFPEQEPIAAEGPLLLFNGSVRGGVRTLYASIYLTVPTPASIVATIEVRKIANGRFGTRALVSIPRVAGGSGSLTSFHVTLAKTLTVEGRKTSPLKLECPNGKIEGRGEALFTDGSTTSTEVVQPCRR